MPRIALTTTVEVGSRLADRCERAGLELVLLPCIAVHPTGGAQLEEARTLAASADLIVVTSARAVAAMWPEADMPAVPVAAVGASTAVAVRNAGGEVAHVGDGGARELIESLGDRVESRTVLFPHAAGAAASSVEALEMAGATVLARPVYSVEPMPPGADPVDAVTFASPSAVDGWLLSRHLDGLVVGAIGNTTADAIAQGDHAADVVSPRPSFDDLIRLMAEHMTDRSAV